MMSTDILPRNNNNHNRTNSPQAKPNDKNFFDIGKRMIVDEVLIYQEDKVPGTVNLGQENICTTTPSNAPIAIPTTHYYASQSKNHKKGLNSPHLPSLPPSNGSSTPMEIKESNLIITVSQSLPLCKGCDCEIKDPYVLKVSPDLEWHASCLKCQACGRILDESCTCYIKNNRFPYCKMDYLKLFGIKCAGCGMACAKTDLVMRAKNLIYHEKCFKCNECLNSLLPGEEFILKIPENTLFCQKHLDIPQKISGLQTRNYPTPQSFFNDNNNHQLKNDNLAFSSYPPGIYDSNSLIASLGNSDTYYARHQTSNLCTNLNRTLNSFDNTDDLTSSSFNDVDFVLNAFNSTTQLTTLYPPPQAFELPPSYGTRDLRISIAANLPDSRKDLATLTPVYDNEAAINDTLVTTNTPLNNLDHTIRITGFMGTPVDMPEGHGRPEFHLLQNLEGGDNPSLLIGEPTSDFQSVRMARDPPYFSNNINTAASYHQRSNVVMSEDDTFFDEEYEDDNRVDETEELTDMEEDEDDASHEGDGAVKVVNIHKKARAFGNATNFLPAKPNVKSGGNFRSSSSSSNPLSQKSKPVNSGTSMTGTTPGAVCSLHGHQSTGHLTTNGGLELGYEDPQAKINPSGRERQPLDPYPHRHFLHHPHHHHRHWNQGGHHPSSNAGGNSNAGSHHHHHHHNNDKVTRVRTVLNEKQLHTLRTCYNANPRPDALMKEQLVEMTALSPRVIRVWFQNKRCKDKKRQILMKQISQAQEKGISNMHGIPLIASSPVRHEHPHHTHFNHIGGGMTPHGNNFGLYSSSDTDLNSNYVEIQSFPLESLGVGSNIVGAGGAIIQETSPSSNNFLTHHIQQSSQNQSIPQLIQQHQSTQQSHWTSLS